jgi:hypothetical protein|tara:strand:- start:2303 stop:2530 length:228 start_codon:yes stop_codon:yes gene_type:complete
MTMIKRMTIDIAFHRDTSLSRISKNGERNKIIRRHLHRNYPNLVFIRVTKQRTLRKGVSAKIVRFWVDTKTRQRG